MRSPREYAEKIEAGELDARFSELYEPSELPRRRERYMRLLRDFSLKFGEKPCIVASAPGRTELCGNHTDHQNGAVLAASVNLDTLVAAAPNGTDVVRLESEGYPPVSVTLAELSPSAAERGSSAALIRGVCAWFAARGCQKIGFDAMMTSEVLGGSGLSSSAAFEVAIGNAVNALWGGAASPSEIAAAGQFAENKYFGKPSGLMDQMASSVGGAVMIDFEKPASPTIRKIGGGLGGLGLKLCIVNTGGSHADLTGHYAAIPKEMRKIAGYYGKRVLREVDEGKFMADINILRESFGDRAALRALHFFADNARVSAMADAMASGDTEKFLEIVRESGRSSLMCLQNIYPPSSRAADQGITLALALSERLLAGGGAARVHGGGFAGTIQSFVRDSAVKAYKAGIEKVFGAGSCLILSIRRQGGCVFW